MGTVENIVTSEAEEASPGIVDVVLDRETGRLVGKIYTDHAEKLDYDPEGNLARVTRYEPDGTSTVCYTRPNNDDSDELALSEPKPEIRFVEGSLLVDKEVEGESRPWLTCSFDKEGRLIGQAYVDLETGETDCCLRFEYDPSGRLKRVIKDKCDGTSAVCNVKPRQ